MQVVVSLQCTMPSCAYIANITGSHALPDSLDAHAACCNVAASKSRAKVVKTHSYAKVNRCMPLPCPCAVLQYRGGRNVPPPMRSVRCSMPTHPLGSSPSPCAISAAALAMFKCVEVVCSGPSALLSRFLRATDFSLMAACA